jgi:PAS domain S-box-containing protein
MAMSDSAPPSGRRAPDLSRERLQGALDAAGLGTFCWDIRTGVFECDANLQHLLRLPGGGPHNLATFATNVHPSDCAALQSALEGCEREGSDFDLEFRSIDESGAVHWLAGRGMTARDPSGATASVSGACLEITHRKYAEERARERSGQLQLALEAGDLGDWSWNAASDVVALSARAARIFGVTLGEPITWTRLREVLHPDDRERARLAIENSLATHTDYDVEYRVHERSGEEVWISARGRGTYTETGDVAGMIGVVSDITARRSAEEALRRRESFHRTIIESSGDCITTLSLDGTLTWISESGCRVLALERPGEIVGASYVRLWDGADREAALEAIEAAAHGGTGTFVGSTSHDGTRFWNVMITPIRGESGEPASLLAVSRDVTERVAIERALREETRVLELLHTTGATLTSQLDVQSLLQTVTDAATELSGAKFGAFFYNMTDENGDAYQLYTLSGAPREAFERFGHPRATPIFAPTFRGEGVIRSDDVRRDPRYGQWAPHRGTPPGHLPIRSYLAVPVVARDGQVFGGLFFGHPETGVFTEKSERIISAIAAQASIAIDNARLYQAAQNAAEERQQLLESERFARAQAERMSAMKDEFLAVLSHELRTPLSAILGWSQVMRNRAGNNADLAKGLEIIERNARAQTQLVEDLLDMSRIVSGKMRLDVQSVAPHGFIEAAVEAVRPAATAKGIRLEVMLDTEIGPISGDGGRLQQVMWNLLSNAIKFTPRGGRVQVLLERVSSHLEISVADTGTGIPPEFLQHVFERFRQADASTTRRHGGLGLGLAIVKHLVEQHGGTVHASSPGEGCGATFTVRLPVMIAHRSDRAARSQPSAQSQTPSDFKAMNLRDVKVLIVDDEPDARSLVTRVLEECGAEVIAAGSADEALGYVERERPSVLVTDIGMPDIDGFQLLRRVRALGEARGGKLPAIALTAFARSEDRTRALSAGFLVHLSKPIEPSELVATVASVAGRAGAEH